MIKQSVPVKFGSGIGGSEMIESQAEKTLKDIKTPGKASIKILRK